MRFTGPIPQLKRDKFPKSLIIFDTEAYRGEFIEGVESQTLRLGVARYISLSPELEILKDEYNNFNSGESLLSIIDWYAHKDKTLFVYAHNLKYDMQLSGILTSLIRFGWKASLVVLQDPPTFVRLKNGRRSIMFVDTFNYWQTSLAKMGDLLGLKKLEMPEGSAPDEDWYIYCRRDVEVLGEYLLTFMRFLFHNDLAGLGLTLASQAFRTFRHRFMTEEIIIHDRKDILALEREGYSGGRVEAFFIGEKSGEDLYKLDVNSMYPFVMKENSFPVEFIASSVDLSLSRLKELTEKFYCIARVEVRTQDPVYPLKTEHKLIFPIGKFETVLHQEELLYALSHGHITKCLHVAIYKARPVFSSYIDYMYGLKLEGERLNNQVLRNQAKLLMNSLYGKFGQREIISKIVDNKGPEKFGRMTGYSESLKANVEVTYLGDTIELRYKGGESSYSFPGIAGGVCAYARMYLWSLITKAGKDNVYYLDTDSLVVTKQGLDNLTPYLDPNQLGYLKLEGTSDRMIIRGAKDYTFASEVKHKGLPKSAIEISPGLWEYEQFRGGITWLNSGLPVGVEVYKRTKRRITPYDKGVVLESGQVIPLTLS